LAAGAEWGQFATREQGPRRHGVDGEAELSSLCEQRHRCKAVACSLDGGWKSFGRRLERARQVRARGKLFRAHTARFRPTRFGREYPAEPEPVGSRKTERTHAHRASRAHRIPHEHFEW
jgi:hypothetical protein